MPTRTARGRAASCRAVVATAPAPGAIAVIELFGSVVPVLADLAGSAGRGDDDWPVGRVRLTAIGDIDTGLTGRAAEDVALVMPHGGPRVVQRLVRRLEESGVRVDTPASIDPRRLYPEARDEPEALMLAALARAVSPLAVSLLLDQPSRWRAAKEFTADDDARSRRLDRLLDPPLVVLAGRPNCGKSTLSNALLGRAASIARDEPGTTRDYTSGLVDLGGLVVRWHDTPGLRPAREPAEREAIVLARRLMARADLIVALGDAEHDWPESERPADGRVARPADLRVASRADLQTRPGADLAVSARTGAGMPELVTAVRDRLVSRDDLAHPGPWRFDERLVTDQRRWSRSRRR